MSRIYGIRRKKEQALLSGIVRRKEWKKSTQSAEISRPGS